MAKKKETSYRTGAGTPKQRNCGAMQEHFHLLETDPNFRKNQVALEHACQGAPADGCRRPRGAVQDQGGRPRGAQPRLACGEDLGGAGE